MTELSNLCGWLKSELKKRFEFCTCFSSFFPLGSDGSGIWYWQTGQSTSAPASGVTFGMPPNFMDASGQTASRAAGLPAASTRTSVVLQM